MNSAGGHEMAAGEGGMRLLATASEFKMAKSLECQAPLFTPISPIP
jgi:hypothetical protein